MSDYRADPQILTLGPDFYDPVRPAGFPKCVARFFNGRWADRVGLGALAESAHDAHFCRFEPLPDNLLEPLALRYHGHQFRVYNPDIGDGRGFLFAQLRDDRGRLLDLGTKGSGTTPYSRTADGRLTLKGAVREILATEMLEALGVNTSKTFAVFETGEALMRGDEPSPTRSAVLTRLGHGHIRIGTFQRLAYFSEGENIRKLTRYCLEHLYSDPPGADDSENAVRLLDVVAQSTATLAASYIAAGFVHGVLNSDNIAISGESFDYGPWRFTPRFDPNFTAAYFDHYGLYAFGRQPEAIQWDLAQLAGALTTVSDRPELVQIVDDWGGRFETALVAALLGRLGVAPRAVEEDRTLAARIITCLQTGAVEFDRFFFDWRGGRDPGAKVYPAESFRVLAQLLGGRERHFQHPYWSDAQPEYDPVETIWSAIANNDDWSPLESKIAAVRRMGDAMAEAPPA